jgi:hypothetical protein
LLKKSKKKKKKIHKSEKDEIKSNKKQYDEIKIMENIKKLSIIPTISKEITSQQNEMSINFDILKLSQKRLILY